MTTVVIRMLKTGDTSYSMIIQERGKKGAIVSTTDGTYLWSSVTHTFRDHVIQTFRGHVTQTFRGHVTQTFRGHL